MLMLGRNKPRGRGRTHIDAAGSLLLAVAVLLFWMARAGRCRVDSVHTVPSIAGQGWRILRHRYNRFRDRNKLYERYNAGNYQTLDTQNIRQLTVNMHLPRGFESTC